MARPLRSEMGGCCLGWAATAYRSNHSVAQPHLRVNFAVSGPYAGRDVCRVYFEMPQTPRGLIYGRPVHPGQDEGVLSVGTEKLMR